MSTPVTRHPDRLVFQGILASLQQMSCPAANVRSSKSAQDPAVDELERDRVPDGSRPRPDRAPGRAVTGNPCQDEGFRRWPGGCMIGS